MFPQRFWGNTVRTNVDFHALRHTFITQLARSGVFPAKAKELARHSTITLTMDVYSHVKTEELQTALDTLPPLVGRQKRSAGNE